MGFSLSSIFAGGGDDDEEEVEEEVVTRDGSWSAGNFVKWVAIIG